MHTIGTSWNITFMVSERPRPQATYFFLFRTTITTSRHEGGMLIAMEVLLYVTCFFLAGSGLSSPGAAKQRAPETNPAPGGAARGLQQLLDPPWRASQGKMSTGSGTCLHRDSRVLYKYLPSTLAWLPVKADLSQNCSRLKAATVFHRHAR